LGEQRKGFNEGFKRQTVKQIQEQRETMAEMAQDLDSIVKILHFWKTENSELRNEAVNHSKCVHEFEQYLRDKEHCYLIWRGISYSKKAPHTLSKP